MQFKNSRFFKLITISFILKNPQLGIMDIYLKAICLVMGSINLTLVRLARIFAFKKNEDILGCKISESAIFP
jgi:hypothetical protein